MPFEIQHTPISALLGLGSIAGQGIGIAQRKADRLREAQQAAQLVAQQLSQQNEQQNQANQLQAQSESTRIQQGLEYSKQASEQDLEKQKLQQDQAQADARNQLLQEQGQAEQATKNREIDLNQQKLQQTTTNTADKTAQVNAMIDNIYPPGSPENEHMKLQFTASGRIPAPQSESQARNLNALVLARHTLVDPIGDALPGKEQQLAAIDQQIQSITQGITQNPAQMGAQPSAPQPIITAVNPQTGQRIKYDPASQTWVPLTQ